jgi:hypothetical protein
MADQSAVQKDWMVVPWLLLRFKKVIIPLNKNKNQSLIKKNNFALPINKPWQKEPSPGLAFR